MTITVVSKDSSRSDTTHTLEGKCDRLSQLTKNNFAYTFGKNIKYLNNKLKNNMEVTLLAKWISTRAEAYRSIYSQLHSQLKLKKHQDNYMTGISLSIYLLQHSTHF